MSNILSHARGDLAGAAAAAAVTVPASIVYGLIAFAPLGAQFAGHGILAGLYASVAAALVVALAGGAAGIITGPLATTALVLGASMGQLGASGALADDPEIVIALAFLMVLASGVLQVLFGALRLGGVVKFVSYPVFAGIMNGTAIVLAIGAGRELLAVAGGGSAGLLPCVAVAAASVLPWFMAGLMAGRISPRVPGPVLGLAVGTALYYLLGALGIDAGGTIAAVPASAPLVNHWGTWSSLDIGQLGQFVPIIVTAAATIAILGSVESLFATLTLQNLTGTRPDGNRELLAQGLGNIANAFAGALPASGTPSRTRLNHEAGGRTRLSGLLFALITLAAVLFGARFVDALPRAVVIGMTVAVALVIVDKWSIRLIHRVLRGDFGSRREHRVNIAIIAGVAASVVAFGMLAAVALGMLTSVVMFIVQMGKSVVRGVLDGSRLHSRKLRHVRTMDVLRSHGGAIAVLELQGALFFGATDRMLREIDTLVAAGVRYLVIDFRRINDADISAAAVLARTCGQLDARGVVVALSYLPEDSRLRVLLEDLGFGTRDGDARVFPDTDLALEYCEDLLLAAVGEEAHSAAARGLEQLLELEDLSEAEKDALHTAVDRRAFAAGSYLCRQGEPGDSLFVIEHGRADISIGVPGQVRRKRLATLGPGSVFGEMALLDRGVRSADVQVVEDLRCYEITNRAFNRLKDAQPRIALIVLDRLARVLVARLRSANETIGELER